MRDLVIILSIAGGVATVIALAIATWHTLRLELLRHHAKPGSGDAEG